MQSKIALRFIIGSILLSTWFLNDGSHVCAQLTQAERRNQLSSPGLSIESKLPTARVNVIKVHNERIYVAGQDHVVRSYALKNDGEIDTDSCKIYRWPSWREERGNILSLAINEDGTRFAIGGVGLKSALVCEIEIATGTILRSDDSLRSAITEIQYTESGDLWYGSFRGGVVLWEQQKPAKIIVKERNESFNTLVCSITPSAAGCYAIFSDGLVSVIQNGIVSQTRKIIEDPLEEIFSSINLSSNNTTCALITRNKTTGNNYIKTWNTGATKTETLWQERSSEIVMDSIISNSSGKIQGIGRSPKRDSFKADLVLLDVDSKKLQKLSSVDVTDQATALALTTDESLYVSQQRNFLSRYALQDTNLGSSPARPGANKRLDSVFWIDGQKIGWTKEAEHSGFDLNQRQVLNGVVPAASNKDVNDPSPFVDLATDSQLSLKFKNGQTKAIELNIETDRRATSCKIITFNQQKFALVGHRFGTSVFSIAKNYDLQLVRKLIGHSDDVTSIDFQNESGLILTSGNDGAISCFSLAPWKFHPELGASFRVANGKLSVGEIDPGSPIWETGLNEGEVIDNLYYMGSKVDNSKANETLQKPKIGEQFQFQTTRLQQGVSTRSLQRPIWKFYERDGEWIWWRWRDYYYDCSTQGERLVSWQLNQGLDRAPISIDGTEARARFYRPQKLKDLLSKSTMTPERINAPELVPPRVVMSVVDRQDHYLVTATLQPEANSLLVGEPKQLSVWVNDYRISNWNQPQIGRPESCRLEKRFLRSGTNRIIARAFNRIGIRGDSDAQVVVAPAKQSKSVLRGLAIGIRDYSNSRKVSLGGRGLLASNLKYTVRDAMAIKRLFEKQTNDFSIDVQTLIDDQATSENVYRQIDLISQKCDPNDWLILSFAGHGYCWEKQADSNLPSSFMLLTSQTSLISEADAGRSAISIGALNEGVQFESLFNALAKVPCRKLLLVDACHSGGALDIVKALTPDLIVGPTIITASQKSQKAQEVPTKAHGVFTAAIVEATSFRFDEADQTRDERISPRELYGYTLKRVPEIFQYAKRHLSADDFQKGQTPDFWSPSEDQDIPIFARVQD